MSGCRTLLEDAARESLRELPAALPDCPGLRSIVLKDGA